MIDQVAGSVLCPEVKIPALRYYGYASVVGVKRTLSLRTHKHRKFFVWKFIKLLESGIVRRDCLRVTAAGKTDGVGAQALAKFSAMCLAEAYGIGYAHTPFVTLAHAELPMVQWIESWETLLGMGELYSIPSDEDFPTVDVERYVSDPSIWNKRATVSTRHYHGFCELAPEFGEVVSQKLQAAYHGSQPIGKCDVLDVCVHVRRGDVSPGDSETRHRYTANNKIISVIHDILDAAALCGINVRVKLFSNGEPSEFTDFACLPEVELRLSDSALETFNALADAHILVTARSDFSHLAANFCRGVVICDPSYRTPLSHWLRIDPTRSRVCKDALALKLQNHFLNGCIDFT